MKLRFLIPLLLCLPSWATISVLQTKTTPWAGGAPGMVATFSTNVTAGSLIWAQVGCYPSTSCSITNVKDNVNNTNFTQAVTLTAATTTSAIYFLPNSASGTMTVTATGVSISFSYLMIMEISGVLASSPLDATATGTSTAATTVTSGTFSTGTANEILTAGAWATLGGSDQYTAQASPAWTLASVNCSNTVANCGDEYLVVSSTQSSITASMNSTVALTSGILVATFKAASGGASGHCASCDLSKLRWPE